MSTSKQFYKFSLFSVGLILSLASLTVLAQTKNAKEGIASANREFENAFSKSNAVDIASQYTKDAELLLVSEDAIRGPKIQDFFEKFLLHSGARKIRLETTKLEEMGPWANETGTFITVAEDDKTVLGGRYTAIWKLEDQKWKIQVHIFSPNRRPEKE